MNLGGFGLGAPGGGAGGGGGVTGTLPIIVTGNDVEFGTAIGPTVPDATIDALVGGSADTQTPLGIQVLGSPANGLPMLEFQSSGGGYLTSINFSGGAALAVGNGTFGGSQGVFIGNDIQNQATDCVGIGYQATKGNDLDTGPFAIGIGRQALLNNTRAHALAMGNLSGVSNGGQNVQLFGDHAGNGNSGSDVSAMGANSALSNLGTSVAAFGSSACRSNAASNVFGAGENAGQNNTSSNACFIGSGAGSNNTSTVDTTGIGADACNANSGDNVIGIGLNAVRNNTQDQVIGIGSQAAQDNIGTIASFIGVQCGISNAGDRVNGFGNLACSANTGDNVIGIGTSAGAFNTFSDVVLIGDSAVATENQQCVIGTAGLPISIKGWGGLALATATIFDGGSPYNVVLTDYTLCGGDAAGNVVFNLPSVSATPIGRILNFKKLGLTNTTTVQASGAETIDGANTLVLTVQYQSAQIQNNGTSWDIL